MVHILENNDYEQTHPPRPGLPLPILRARRRPADRAPVAGQERARHCGSQNGLFWASNAQVQTRMTSFRDFQKESGEISSVTDI
jgi:hypothetical protein